MNLAAQPDAATLALLVKSGGSLPLPFGQEVFLFSCQIAGTSHRDLDEVAPSLEPGIELCMRREPGNSHDDLAIRVQTADGTLLGYVPATRNDVIARLMDVGKLVLGRLTMKEWRGAWLRLEMDVVLRDL